MIKKNSNTGKTHQTIAEIEKIDLRSATVEQIQSLVSVLLDGFSTSAVNVPPGKYIHRTRIWRKPDNISQVSYPPADKAPLGRANDQGIARFYGSIGRSVPFFELNPKVGDKIILSTWKTASDMLLNSVGFTKGSSLLLFSKRELGKLYSLSEAENEAQIVIREFLAKWFVKKIDPADAHLYKITAAIANILLSGENFDGLIYPTVKMFGNADNVVLDRRFVNKSLQLVSIEYLEVTDNECNLEQRSLTLL